jgi:hypothetical protein
LQAFAFEYPGADLNRTNSKKVGDVQHGGWFRTKIRNTLNWLQNEFAIHEHYLLIQDENSKAQEHLVKVSKHLRTLFQIEDATHENPEDIASPTKVNLSLVDKL